MSKVRQIHFNVAPKQARVVKRCAKRDKISVSEYYRKSALKQAKREAFAEKVHNFDHELAHDNSPVIRSKKDFIKWLQK